MNILADLFLSFAKIGAFTFGGGYAMLSLIEDHCVEKRKWITHDEMMNVTVIAESTPGPIAINCATYVGYKQAGIPGAILATLGVVLPSFIIIYVISKFLDTFLEIPLIANAFRGIKLAVGLLILNAGIKMLKKTEKKPLPMGVFAGSFVLILLSSFGVLSFSSIVLMLAAGVLSLCVFLLTRNHGKGGEGA